MPDFEETIERLKIKFKKHPNSKKFSDTRFQWHSYFLGTLGIIETPIRKNAVIPSNQKEQFGKLIHEIGHIEEKHLRPRHPCNHWFDSCLQHELEANLNVIENLKKIRKRFNKDFWVENVNQLQNQCKNCLKAINRNQCPSDAIKKIEKYLDVVDKAFGIESGKIIFPEREEEKEHQIISDFLIGSDKRVKKLLEIERVKKLGIKFIKHPESHKFCDTPQRKIWIWRTSSDKKIAVPLDKNNSVMPYSKDERLFTLGQEISHLLLGEFRFKCDCDTRNCLSLELQAFAKSSRLFPRANIRFKKSFWRSKLTLKLALQEECLETINRGKCSKKECEKIKKSFREIAQNIKE